jgi:hypothetical protein
LWPSGRSLDHWAVSLKGTDQAGLSPLSYGLELPKPRVKYTFKNPTDTLRLPKFISVNVSLSSSL